jgi:hypothetical protein
VSKWIKFEKHPWGLASSLVFFNKINFYAGQSDHWGIGANINFYDRSLTLEILNLYLGLEIWHEDSDIVELEKSIHPPQVFRDTANAE